VLEGQVTNVTAFGAFVDVGVHQDGLVHISAMSDTFIKDPRSVVKAGDIVKVKVMSVDTQRNRIALSMRLSDKAEDTMGNQRPQRGKPAGKERKLPPQASHQEPESALALSLKSALAGKAKN